jgi:hypothetical protein
MKVKLKCLFRKGEFLRASDLECTPDYVGNLVIEEWISPHGCYVHQARLLDVNSGSSAIDMIPPLVEAEQVTKTGKCMILRGYQIYWDLETGASRNYEQAWVVHLFPNELQQ